MSAITISLTDLRFYAHHGMMEQETIVGNEFIVNVSFDIHADELKLMEARGEEDLKFTVSYADVYDVIKSEMAIPSKLLETLAIRIARRLRERFNRIRTGSISITKLTPPIPSISGSATVTYCF